MSEENGVKMYTLTQEVPTAIETTLTVKLA
jgi:hypothetical protein